MSDESQLPAERWHGETAEALATAWGAPRVHLFARVGSTNDVARTLAEEGAPAGTVVVADEQVAGRGRAGRSWSSPAGVGLSLSIVARPTSREAPRTLPLLVGLEVALAVDDFLRPGAAHLKWPNDVLSRGRKLGGVLCEAAWAGDTPAFVVVGVGINVLHESADFPAELRAQATSLRMEGAASVTTLSMASRLVPALLARLSGPAGLDDESLRDIRHRDELHGRPVVVSDPLGGAELGRGIAGGIATDGALLVHHRDGELYSFHSGTVRIDQDPSADP